MYLISRYAYCILVLYLNIPGGSFFDRYCGRNRYIAQRKHYSDLDSSYLMKYARKETTRFNRIT